ncbi:Cu/Pi carrier [Coemansia spiralis]|uniref:Cu/Pi carrier n=2 Tax=Coemansia TaxID=4863 RepID=A0A9W8G3Q2_9FUNG|nr:mitochondrial phosphate carrier protein [Coemansia spiralis]KAJ1995420.1 Cu/Pi carrier [Coemansia umbellata]KAJ2624752.1 Cu/Pi carrier [Coemansia sp. RSA 1358]KAJ2678294.1 Cu/Pi carrier [Coemansia spiralis]
MLPSTQTLSAFKGTQKPFVAFSPAEKRQPFVAHSTIEVNSAKYFYTCAIGGAMACGLTHYALTPVDMLKCRMQVNKNLYKGIFDGFKKVSSAEGLKGLYLGGAPTIIGYSLQGMGKYGFYEYFKHLYSGFVGDEAAAKYKTLLYLSASASAEFIADVLLCPMEALKVKTQTSTTPFATSFLGGVRKINAAEGLNGFYKGLTPLWLRQIPYTMVKFATFEKTVEAIYKHVLSKPKDQYTKTEQLGVTFAAGYFAGIFCAIVSHPADTLVSKLNNAAKAEGESTGALAMRILKDLGFAGVWAGLGPRIFMIGTLTALQWFIYDSFKVQTGLPTTGGAAAPKKE